ncbi:MAG: hypothetical protein AAFR03_09500 [Pseudomonadota bacterium]
MTTTDNHCLSPSRPVSCDLCSVREQSICADLRPKDLAQVEKTMARRTISKGRALMEEGEPNDSLYVLSKAASAF